MEIGVLLATTCQNNSNIEYSDQTGQMPRLMVHKPFVGFVRLTVKLAHTVGVCICHYMFHQQLRLLSARDR